MRLARIDALYSFYTLALCDVLQLCMLSVALGFFAVAHLSFDTARSGESF
jgi:hypothetical protein